MARAFSFRGEKKLNTVQKKKFATRNQICHMTFSSPKVHSLSLTCTRMDADTKYASQVHTLSASPPESQCLFPQTILHCFLQSPNWLYPDPAHRPESQTIKNSIYIPAASTWAPTACDYTHIGPHHLWVIFNFGPFSIFI